MSGNAPSERVTANWRLVLSNGPAGRIVEIMSGLVLMATLTVVTIGSLRNSPLEARLPFVIGTIACVIIFQFVRSGSESYGWYLIPIVLILAPYVPRAIRPPSESP